MTAKLKNAVLSTMLFAIIGAVVYAADIYKYRCSKCGLILTFDKKPITFDDRKCPKDGTIMDLKD